VHQIFFKKVVWVEVTLILFIHFFHGIAGKTQGFINGKEVLYHRISTPALGECYFM
jgi:hypothetical protein